jgi:hypothetical protein
MGFNGFNQDIETFVPGPADAVFADACIRQYRYRSCFQKYFNDLSPFDPITKQRSA